MALHTDLLWLAGGRMAGALVAIASLRIMTSILEPKDYGLYVLLIAFQGFCGLILISPIGLHINRHTHAWWDDGTILKRLIVFNRYIFAVSVGIALVVMVWWLVYPGTDHSISGALLSAFAVSSIVYLGTWNATFVSLLNMLGFRISSVVWLLISSIVGLGFSSLFAYEYQTGTSWVLGQAVGIGVGALGAGFMLRQYHAERKMVEISSENSPRLLNRHTILTYCLPLAAATGLLWLQNTGYRFWVGSAWGANELGLLAVGLSVSSQIWAITESLSMQFLNPYFFRHITEVQSVQQKSSVLSDMVNVMWPIYAVLAGFNLVFASALLTVLTNDDYHTAVTFVLFGVLIEFSRCTGNLWSYAAQIERRTTKYILPYALGALTVWGGALSVSAVKGDIKFFAVVLTTSGLFVCGAMVLTMQRMIPVKLDVPRWLAGAAVLLSCVAVLLIMPLKIDGLLNTIMVISVGFFVSGGVMLAFLWNNPALKRLISVSLRTV